MRSTSKSPPPAHEALSAAYEASLPPDQRKRHGVYFTPPAVARTVVHEALLAAPPILEPRVLDPAMGTGIFLLEVARTVPADRRAGFAERCLFGFDIDPAAVRIAISALSAETGARREVLADHLRHGDVLAADLAPGSFDVVVGNPPWGATYGAEVRATLRRRFPEATRHSLDSFKLFLDLGSRLTRGSLGMVVPHAVLGQSHHRDVRRLLLQRMAPWSAENLGDGLFPGAAAPACAIIFGPKPGPRTISLGKNRTIPAQRWEPEHFPLAPDGALQLLARLRRSHPALGDLNELVQVRDVGINYNRAAVAQRIFYLGSQQAPRDTRRFRGRDFHRYSAVRPSGWLRHDARSLLMPGETLSMNPAIYSMPEKIVLRQTSDRIIATLDRSRAAMGRSVIAISATGEISLRGLLVCLNSRLMETLYQALVGEAGRVLPQVKVGKVLTLPVPDVSRGRDTLESVADALLACEGRDAKLIDAADRVVNRLYGLTGEELALLSPPLSHAVL